MPFPRECYNAETLDLMSEVLDAAWDEAEYALASESFDPAEVRTLMSIRIMAAVRDGEHDPARLKELALEAVAKVY